MMCYSCFLYILLLSVSLRLTVSMELIVDSDLTNKNENSFPSLDQALSALLSTSDLLDSENTITLKSNCAGKNQYFPQSQNIHGKSSESGSLTIIYEKSPQLMDSAVSCSQLPTLILTNSSCLVVGNLRSFSVIGLNIQYIENACNNAVTNTNTVAFSNICLNSTEPSRDLAQYTLYYLKLTNIKSLSMMNVFYIHTGAKSIWIDQTSEVILQDITLLTPASSTNNSFFPAFSLVKYSSTHTNLSINYLQIHCNRAAPTISPIVWTEGIDQIRISNMSISNCEFQALSAFDNQTYISISKTSMLTVQQIFLTNLTFNSISPQSIFKLSSVINANLTDFQINSFYSPHLRENISHVVLFNDNDEIITNGQKPSIVFSGWNLFNCTTAFYKVLISGIFQNYQNLGTIFIENFNITHSYLRRKGCIFSLQIQGNAVSEKTNSYAVHVVMNNISISHTMVRYSNMISLTSSSNPKFIAAVERAQIEITHFSMFNVSADLQSSIIYSDGFSVAISEAVVKSITFKTESNLYLNNDDLSTVLISNSTFQKVALKGYSHLVAANVTSTRLRILDSALDGDKEGVFAETKPCMLHNCSFDSIDINSGSNLLTSPNSMVIVHQNRFTRIFVNKSGLLELGNYPFFLSSQSYFLNPDDNALYAPRHPVTLLINEFAEGAIFHHYPDLRDIYNRSRAAMSGYHPEKAIFFICVSENSFSNVSTSGTPNLIQIYNFEIINGTTGVFNNSFEDIVAIDDLNLIGGISIQSGIFAWNSFSRMRFAGYAFTFTSSYLYNLLLDSNRIFETQHSGLYSITSEDCNQIMINSNLAFNVEPERVFIGISCEVINKSVTIQGSIFENIFQTNPQRVITALNFISIIVATEAARSRPPSLGFRDNYFRNITILHRQGYTQNIYHSSLVVIISLESEVQFINNSFSFIISVPGGNIMILSGPTIAFSKCKFYNLSFGGMDGAINAMAVTLFINDCLFWGNKGLESDGVGLIKLSNPAPHNAMVVRIQDTTFRENVAAENTILSVKDTAIILEINRCDISDNQRTKMGGILTLQNTYNSNVTVTNSNCSQNKGYYLNYPALKMIFIDSSGPEVVVKMSDLRMDVTGIAKGAFISVRGQQVVTLLGTRISYSAGSDSSFPDFGLFEGDNFNAVFTNLQISNISLGQTGLFAIRAITMEETENSGEWRLKILDSNFELMKLMTPLIVISSDDYLPTPLNNLSVVIQNTSISNITWLGASNGVVSSSTHRLGRSPDKTDFAIILDNCSFINFTGHTGLVVSAIKPMFDFVALIANCRFYSIIASGPGAILNPSINLFSNITVKEFFIKGGKINPVYKIIRNHFGNISASSGTIFYWETLMKGTCLELEGNHFTFIDCSGNGGLIFAQYIFERYSVPMASRSEFHVISRNDVVIGTSGTQNGGIIYANGRDAMFKITFINVTLSGIKCSGDGGIAYFFSPVQAKEVLLKYLDALLETDVLQQQIQIGSISIANSDLRDITVENGGIIYESTPNNTLNISFDSNTLENVSARARGGAFYLLKPVVSISGNIFRDVTAAVAGPIVYSVSELDLTNFTHSNTIIPALKEFASFAPTNLLVRFIPLNGGSSIMLQYEDTPPYNPIVPNLTSYSLSQYQISLTLVSNGSQGLQVVHDESTTPFVILLFISSKRESIRTHMSNNCSNSTCIVTASAKTLRGLAGDVILVNATYHSSRYVQFQQFSIRLRECLPGEINNTLSQECFYCKPGTYSLSPKDEKCSMCPNGAFCKGGSEIIIRPGFYRSSVSHTSLHMVDCNDTHDDRSRCLGGVNNSCSKPFVGPVCLQCNLENGYAMSANSGTCTLCAKKTVLIVIAAITVLATIIYQIVMTIITFNENKKIHNQYQRQGKLITIQPGQFLVIFSVFTQIASVGNPYTHVMFSMHCLLLHEFHDPHRVVEIQMIVHVFSPLIKILLVMLFEFFRNLIWRDWSRKAWKKSMVRVGAVAVVLIMLEQPSIIGVLCNYLTCSRLDPLIDEEYIKTHNIIRCHTDRYNFFKKAMVIPALAFWAFVVPVAIFLILYKIRRRLFDSRPLRIIFGNLYNSYSEHSYYWGVVIVIFKVTIYVLNSVIRTSPILKAVVFMMIVHLYFHLLKRRPRYNNHCLYLAEKFCCIAYLVTLTLVFIRLSTDISGLKYACSLMIVITLSMALCYILLNILLLYLLTFGDLIQNFVEKRKRKHIISETLESLKTYHKNNPSHIDRHHRRGGICLQLPER